MVPAKTFCAALAYAAAAAAVKDVRFYLLGCHIELVPPNSMFLVAADGARMHVAELQTDEHGITDSFIVGSDDVAKLLALYKKEPGALAVYRKSEKSFGVSTANASAEFPTIDGRFPDWRKVVPTGDCSHLPGHWNPGILGPTLNAMEKLQKGVAYPCVKVTPYGNNTSPAMRVDATRTPYKMIREAFAVVMGIREK